MTPKIIEDCASGGPTLLPDAAATAALGALIGAALRRGDVMHLIGDIGAGKTTLARAAIQRRLGRAEETPSPTFTLVQTYEADIPICHADLYRLTDRDELWELGLIDAFEEAAVLIEWPERLGDLAPARRIEIELAGAGADGRAFSWAARGGGWDHVLPRLRAFSTQAADDF